MSARIVMMAAAALLLSACTEEPQTLRHGNATDQGKPYFDGTGSNFMAKGWTAGDKGSWQQEMKTRMQRGQNEYSKLY